MSRIVASKRAAAALAVAAAAGWGAVELSSVYLIEPWEGTELVAYRDVVGVWTACTGETKGIKPGMQFTPAQCAEMLHTRLKNDFESALQKCIAGFSNMPISVQASFLSGAYNHGAASMCNSTAAKHARAGRYREACLTATWFNKAGGRVWTGLVNRREMGDEQRIGEAELCVTGLK